MGHNRQEGEPCLVLTRTRRVRLIALEIVEGKGKTLSVGEGRDEGGGDRRRLIKTKDEKRTAFADLTAQPRRNRDGRGATHAQNANGGLMATGVAASTKSGKP